MRQVVLDCETTGLDPNSGHRIIEIGCIELNDRCIGRNFHRFLNPDRQSDAAAFEVHGISDEQLRDKQRFAEVWDELHGFIKSSELIIHNAAFDLSFFDAELGRMGRGSLLEEAGCTVCDTLELARDMHPSLKNNLDALSDRYSIDRTSRDDRHGALIDAELLARVYLAMTGGQVAMSFAGEEKEAAADIAVDVAAADLPVIRADAGETAAHEDFIQWLKTARSRMPAGRVA